MGYIIIDLEFNNLNNIDKYYNNFFDDNKGLDNIDFDNEIIEIGAVKVDKYMKIVDTMKTYITPCIFPVINPKVTEITKIDMELLEDKGTSFSCALDKLKNMFQHGDILCSWAKDDIAELIRNAKYYNYNRLEWIEYYIDIQEYASNVLGHKKVMGLKNALDELRIKNDNKKFHDALNDSMYTLEVLKRIYNPRVIKNYIVNDIYNIPAINVKNLGNIIIEEKSLKLMCPKCQKKLRLETAIKLFQWRFVAIGKCSKCNNNILCEISVKETLRGERKFIETNSILKNETYLKYIHKFEKIKKNN
ncbi:MAG: exonuclease domain-containing protein [Clostridium butyricum]|nr:exonuclease domain-containing protein [Clostridium butyricum]